MFVKHGVRSDEARAHPKAPPVWRQPDGKPVSCLEKIKVLNQNIQEIETLCADALEDGVLMGCDADQIKAALHEPIDGLAAAVPSRQVSVRGPMRSSRPLPPACWRCCGADAATPTPRQPPRPSSANLRPIPDGPGKRVAELQGLDKVTARTQRFYAPVASRRASARSRSPSAIAWSTRPKRRPESAAYLTIVDHKPGQAAEKLFAGWMFASTPSLSALDHGVYDVRVLSCTMAQDPRRPVRAETSPGWSTASASRIAELLARDLDRAEAPQMLGHELAVERRGSRS